MGRPFDRRDGLKLVPLPSNFSTGNLKGYHYLDEGCTWIYARYTEVNNIKEAVPGCDAHLFVFHIKCTNHHGADVPRAVKVEHWGKPHYKLLCSGCGVLTPEEAMKTATMIWLLERTKYA